MEGINMRILYLKPELYDLSQGSRIAFARQFRFMTQNDVSDRLGLTGECKRRTMTRYEKGDRIPKKNRTIEIAKILNVSYNAIKEYKYDDPIDLFYTLLWLEEYIPKYKIDISNIPNIKEKNIRDFKKFINDWDYMREKRNKREISYEEYIEWKLTYEVDNYE